MTSADLDAVEVNEEFLFKTVYGDRDVGVGRGERHAELLTEKVNHVVFSDVSNEVVSARDRRGERESRWA